MNRRRFFRFLASAAPVALVAGHASASSRPRFGRYYDLGEVGPEAIVPLPRPTLAQLRVSAEMDPAPFGTWAHCDNDGNILRVTPITEMEDLLLKELREYEQRLAQFTGEAA